MVIGLLEYTYRHTARAESGGGSQLRELMIRYASGVVDKMGRLGAFRELLASDGEIKADLVMKLAI